MLEWETICGDGGGRGKSSRRLRVYKWRESACVSGGRHEGNG